MTFRGEPIDLPGQAIDISGTLTPAGHGVVRMLLVPVFHHPHQLPGVERALPICWLIEVAERTGARSLEADADAWQLSFDLGNVPPYGVADNKTPATCPDCLEWLHA